MDCCLTPLLMMIAVATAMAAVMTTELMLASLASNACLWIYFLHWNGTIAMLLAFRLTMPKLAMFDSQLR